MSTTRHCSVRTFGESRCVNPMAPFMDKQHTYATSQLTAADHSSQADESYSYNDNGNRTMHAIKWMRSNGSGCDQMGQDSSMSTTRNCNVRTVSQSRGVNPGVARVAGNLVLESHPHQLGLSHRCPTWVFYLWRMGQQLWGTNSDLGAIKWSGLFVEHDAKLQRPNRKGESLCQPRDGPSCWQPGSGKGIRISLASATDVQPGCSIFGAWDNNCGHQLGPVRIRDRLAQGLLLAGVASNPDHPS